MVLSSIRYKLSAVIVWEKEILPTGQMLDSFLEQVGLESNFES